MQLPAVGDALAPGIICSFPVTCYYFFSRLGFCVCVCVCLLRTSRFGSGFWEIFCGLWHREEYCGFFQTKHLLQSDCKCTGLDRIVSLLQSCVPPATDYMKCRNYLQFYKKETWSSKASLKYTLNKIWCVYFSELSFENCPLNYCSEKLL